MPRVRPIGRPLVCSLLVLGAGCGVLEESNPDDAFKEPRVHSALYIVSGDSQTGNAGAGLANPLVVRYYRVKETTPAESTATGGIAIDWTVEQGAGTLAGARSATDADGLTQNTLVLGASAGPQRVRATVNGATASATFNATAVLPQPPPPPGVASVSVSPQGPTVQVQQTTQLTATVTLAPGASGTPVITWSSADEAKATVAGNGSVGTVTGVAAGDVVIRATASLNTSSAQGTATVHVVAAPAPITVAITVAGAGTGAGHVTSQGIPGGDVDCVVSSGSASGSCQVSFSDSDGRGSVSLSAASSQGSGFGGWTGCGAGSSGTTCVLPYDATSNVDLTVTARFEPQAVPPPLGVNEFIVFDNDPDGPGPSGSNLVILDVNSQFAITTGAGINTEPSWPDGTRIAFRTKRNDPKGDVWVMNADGSSATLLSGSSSFDHDPDWSSTNKVVFVSERAGNDELWLVDMNAPGNAIRLTNTPGDELEPAFSPDGSRIAYTVDVGYGTTGIFVRNTDGTGVTSLTYGTDGDGEPSWSPDGTRMVFTRHDQLWLINADGTGGLQQLTSGNDDGDPVFSPDGAWIAFTRGPEGARKIYFLSLANPGNPQPLAISLPGTNGNLDWIRKP